MSLTPYVASLRVYEPIESFAELERLSWESVSPETHTKISEQLSALKRLINSELPTAGRDGAHFIESGGLRYAAPWSTSKRCLAAFDEFKGTLPSSVIPMFFPKSEYLERIEVISKSSFEKVHILNQTWMIPPRWFVLFSPEERIRGSDSDGAFTILRTGIERAKERCTNAHRAILKSFGLGPVEEELTQLMGWLNTFDTRAIVECDYGGLAIYLNKSLKEQGESGLDADTSIEDVHLSIEGLANGDGAKAGVGYERLMARWGRVAAYERAT